MTNYCINRPGSIYAAPVQLSLSEKRGKILFFLVGKMSKSKRGQAPRYTCCIQEKQKDYLSPKNFGKITGCILMKFTSGYSPSFKRPAQEVMEEMECFILFREKFRLSNVALFLSFHTAQRRLHRAAYHNFLASFLIRKVDHPIIKSLIHSGQTHSTRDKAMRRSQNLQTEGQCKIK